MRTMLFNSTSSRGPAAGAPWERRESEDEAGRPLGIWAVPDAANGDRAAQRQPPLFHCLPALPRPARDPGGAAKVSLTLVLSRRPEPGEASVWPLVDRGRLVADLALVAPAEALERLARETGADFRPLFKRRTRFRLRTRGGTVLAEGVAEGAGAGFTLQADLPRDAALAALAALRGETADLDLACVVAWRPAPAPAGPGVQVRADWARVHRTLSAAVGPDRELLPLDLRNYLDLMLRDGTVAVSGVADTDRDAMGPSAAAFVAFLRAASVVLEPLTPGLPADDDAARYCLRPAPPAAETTVTVNWSSSQRVPPADADDEFELAAALRDIFAGAVAPENVAKHIQLLCPSGAAGGPLEPVPQRTRTRLAATRDGQDPAHGMASLGGGLESLSRAIRPTSRPPAAHLMLASEAVRPQLAVQPATLNPAAGHHAVALHPAAAHAAIHHWALDDLVVERPDAGVGGQPPNRSLPVVDDPEAPLWPDRVKSSEFWYAPQFAVVLPAANADPASAPFRFDFAPEGHDQEGRPGLNGTVRITLRQEKGAATLAAWEQRGKPAARPVAFTTVGVTLEVPFRDAHGTTRAQPFEAQSVEQSGDLVVATFKLLDGWVRLCYGALSTANFQSQPARVRVSYAFEAYHPIKPDRLQLLFGGKAARIPVVRSEEDAAAAADKPYAADAVRGVMRLPQGELRFVREAPHVTRRAVAPPPPGGTNGKAGRRGSGASKSAHRGGAIAGRAAATAARPAPAVSMAALAARPHAPAATHAIAALAIRPGVESQALLQSIIRRKRYAVRTRGTTVTRDVLFPCADYGALYLEKTAEGERAVGCRDAFKLGQIEYRLYASLEDAALPPDRGFQVYRSLQIPGRFMVVPSAYYITRFEASEGEKAYRPAVFLYSSIDANDPSRSRCVVTATLQPDLAPASRRELAETLKKFHRTPTVEYVTEIPSELTYDWSIPSPGEGGGGPLDIRPQASKHWDCFQINLAAAVNSVPQLQAMLLRGSLTANVTFRLPDDSTLQVALRPDLTRIVGPWQRGAVEGAVGGGTVRVTNRIDRPADVSEARVYAVAGDPHALRVEQRLQPGAEWSGPAPDGLGDGAEAFAVYSVEPAAASLPEVRSFIEDIHTNVVFLNLVNFANHDLARLDVKARLKDVPGEHELSLTEQEPLADADFVLPLTQYLGEAVLQYQVARTDRAGNTARSDWKDWPLARLGNVVSLTWEQIA